MRFTTAGVTDGPVLVMDEDLVWGHYDTVAQALAEVEQAANDAAARYGELLAQAQEAEEEYEALHRLAVELRARS